MTEFHARIRLGTPAMQDTPDIADVLLDVAGHISTLMPYEGSSGWIHDADGNRVGDWSLTPDTKPDPTTSETPAP